MTCYYYTLEILFYPVPILYCEKIYKWGECKKYEEKTYSLQVLDNCVLLTHRIQQQFWNYEYKTFIYNLSKQNHENPESYFRNWLLDPESKNSKLEKVTFARAMLDKTHVHLKIFYKQWRPSLIIYQFEYNLIKK